jgi:hypothetical protein
VFNLTDHKLYALFCTTTAATNTAAAAAAKSASGGGGSSSSTNSSSISSSSSSAMVNRLSSSLTAASSSASSSSRRATEYKSGVYIELHAGNNGSIVPVVIGGKRGVPVPGETPLESVYEPLIQQLQLSSAPALLPCRDDEAVRFMKLLQHVPALVLSPLTVAAPRAEPPCLECWISADHCCYCVSPSRPTKAPPQR